jgi:hypothetical protein
MDMVLVELLMCRCVVVLFCSVLFCSVRCDAMRCDAIKSLRIGLLDRRQGINSCCTSSFTRSRETFFRLCQFENVLIFTEKFRIKSTEIK